MVFDDVHWSKGMEEAWNEIIDHSSIQVSIDLFEMGVVIIDKQYIKTILLLIRIRLKNVNAFVIAQLNE
mgnify:CR=1 FL=1